MRFASSIVLLAVAAGCPGPKAVQRPYPAPTAEDLIARLAKQRAERHAFTAESTMDYWLGKDRVKGTVLVMGTTGKKVRFNALSPAGGDVIADMACDGANFAYVDKQHNCQLSGPCDRNSIAQLLRVELEPEDFLYLALGTVPVIDGQGAVAWDASKGREKLTITGPAGTETIEIDARDNRFDVAAAKLVSPGGQLVWSVENADWGTVNDAAGGVHRLPSKTRLKSPRENADLLVDWGDRTVNPTIDDSKFVVQIPQGLPMCGSK
jgi:hypothetical protein